MVWEEDPSLWLALVLIDWLMMDCLVGRGWQMDTKVCLMPDEVVGQSHLTWVIPTAMWWQVLEMACSTKCGCFTNKYNLFK